MKIELWPVTKPVPYPGNPRINDGAVKAVAKSLKEYGFRQPIVVDTDGVVVCGHTRLKAASKLGLEQVPLHVATDLTADQIRAYRIADNQTATIAEWNMDLLPLELCGLRDDGYDLSLLGFDAEELDRILGGEVSDGGCDPDDIPLPPEEPVTRPGDVWILGNHRLLCGDATKPGDVARLMNGQRADLLLTDPPYGVDYVGKTKDALKIANDAMSAPAFRNLILDAFTNAFDVIQPGAAFYIWHADSEGYTFRGVVHDCGQRVRQAKILIEQASRYGIPFGSATVSLPKVVRALHDFLADNKHKLARDDDEMLSGPASPALERYREERALMARLQRLEREGELLPRDLVRPSLSKTAALIRTAGESLEKQFGSSAAQLLYEAIEDAESEIDRFFAERQPEGNTDVAD